VQTGFGEKIMLKQGDEIEILIGFYAIAS